MLLATFIGATSIRRRSTTIDFSLASQPPVLEHPFGTDSLGQDILARILWGGRISLAVGIVAALVAILARHAHRRGRRLLRRLSSTALLMRITDLFISLPQVPLLLLISFLYRDRSTRCSTRLLDGQRASSG